MEHTCKKCKGNRFKTVVKGKEFACRNCGEVVKKRAPRKPKV